MANELIVVLLSVSIILDSVNLYLNNKSDKLKIDFESEYQKAVEMEERVKELKAKIEATCDRISKLTSKN